MFGKVTGLSKDSQLANGTRVMSLFSQRVNTFRDKIPKLIPYMAVCCLKNK